jgi:hypothetical protein
MKQKAPASPGAFCLVAALNVRFGSKADVMLSHADVRSYPESGH